MRKEKVLNNATVCFLCRDGKILLGLKQRNIGQGCWNGYGGGIEDGEGIVESAVRELQEEAGVTAFPPDLEKVAIIDFHNTKSDGEIFVCKVHFYFVYKWDGEVIETEEMITPTWFDVNNLPLDKMMPTDQQWLPVVLGGKKIIATAYLSPFQEKSIGETEIECVESFPDE